LPDVLLHDGATHDAVSAGIERAFLTGVLHVAEGEVQRRPAACIPLDVEDRTVGVIVVNELLAQKPSFVTVDRELFKLLGAHAGGAIVAGYLYASGDARFPSPEMLRSLLA
jgi:hypothetical protein